MNRQELRRRLSQRPNAVRFTELERLLRLSGFDPSSVRGSHHIFRDATGRHISVPRRVPFVRVPYVRGVLDITREVGDDV